MKKLVVIVWSITLCIAIGGVMMHYAIVRNVFDEMYYTWDKPNLVLTRFTNVPSLAENSFVGKTYGGGSITNHLYLIYDGNFKETDENYLMDSTSVSFSVLTDDYNCISGSGTINYAKTDDDTRAETFSIRFVYDIKTKELTIKPVIISSKFLSEQEPEKYSNYTSYEDKETIEKFIALHNITKSEIDTYKSYILNDVLIGLWVEGNGRASKFTVENPGEFTIIDNSYINLGEDWQD
ncbi:MAG: TipC family immunity protein [Eubacteriales bacterium]